MLDMHPNYLSRLLNQKTKHNFSAFINKHRVAHFKKIAGSPEKQHLTLLGLAFESGFNSKTIFNTCFKKETGMSPREYIKKYGPRNKVSSAS